MIFRINKTLTLRSLDEFFKCKVQLKTHTLVLYDLTLPKTYTYSMLLDVFGACMVGGSMPLAKGPSRFPLCYSVSGLCVL